MKNNVPQESSPKWNEFRDLLPGFCPEIPDLSVRVWHCGLVKVISRHYGEVGWCEDGPALVVCRRGSLHLGLLVARLAYAGFAEVPFVRIESVRHLDADPANCEPENLEAVCIEVATSDDERDAMRQKALADGLALGKKAELTYDDEYLERRHAWLAGRM